jgi:AhpD family alkylhydroperoxidase
MRLREYFLELYKNKANIKITLTDIITKVVIEVIKRMPIFNATLIGDVIKISEQINLGVAVATDKGLIVPVIHNANEISLEEISETVRSIAEKARSSTLSLDEVTGGTFTVSNLGMFGIEVFTPIINPPEAAILGIGKIIQKPVVKENRIEICPMMILSLTHDHRIMDGVDAAKFLQNMKAILEDPYPIFNVSPDLSRSKPSKPVAEKPATDKAAVRFVEMMKKRGHSILGHEPAQMDLIGAHNPQIIADFVRLHRDGLSEGVLPAKIKALMALSIAVVVGCESCMKWHLMEAVESGATDEEISETLAITVFMGGGPALMHSETVADYLKTLRK